MTKYNLSFPQSFKRESNQHILFENGFPTGALGNDKNITCHSRNLLSGNPINIFYLKMDSRQEHSGMTKI
jgi:hypothetical protein